MLTMKIPTPYYLIDEKKLLLNLKKIKYVREISGTKSLLALKCFSTWCVFGLMKKHMDGTTSSSLFEARLGHEKFGGETHAYSVAYTPDEVKALAKFSDKIIFNSCSQLKSLSKYARGLKIGLRVNPSVSYSHFDLANPARKFSRLGVIDKKSLLSVADAISGVMFHFNCENDNFNNFSKTLDYIENNYGSLLKKLEWVSLGGGIFFTKGGYPLDKFCAKLKQFAKTFGVQIYLEPGESAITGSAELVTTVLDVVHNEKDIAIVDASTEAHMLDLLIYRLNAKIYSTGSGPHKYIIAGHSCLAGDVFGEYCFPYRLKVGSIVRFNDAAGYTMVKMNWFNGLQMPTIAVKRLNGKIEVIRSFGYKDFVGNLS